jgi:uncharacterized membrane protein
MAASPPLRLDEQHDPFASVLGARRGSRRDRRLSAAYARTQLRASGHVLATSKSDVVAMVSAGAAAATCRECGQVGLRPELYLSGRVRRWRVPALVGFVVALSVTGWLLHVPGAAVPAFTLAVVGWQLIRDFGYRVLGVCSRCRCAQPL